MAKKKKSTGIEIYGDFAHNHAFCTAIGQLVINWANCESVFLAMIQLATAKPEIAFQTWHSLRTTKARADLSVRMVRAECQDVTLCDEIGKAAGEFDRISAVRNFYCHAMYEYDDDLHMTSANGAATPPSGGMAKSREKPLDAEALNEIQHAAHRCVEINQSLWTLVHRLEESLGRQISARP